MKPVSPTGADGSVAVGVIAYFGYGSLINRATHRTEIVTCGPARLRGWRRYWRPRPDMPGFPAALLTVRREKNAACDGLLVIDRAENLEAVDRREARYNRMPLAPDDFETMACELASGCPIFVYEAQADLPPHPERPLILRSYLDAVLQGVLAEFGEAGVRRFFDETDGFDTAIHDDRAAPVYPRAVRLSENERVLINEMLAAHGVTA